MLLVIFHSTINNVKNNFMDHSLVQCYIKSMLIPEKQAFFTQNFTCSDVCLFSITHTRFINDNVQYQSEKQQKNSNNIQFPGIEYVLGQLLFSISTEFEKTHQNSRHVHVRLPHREASSDQVDGCPPDGAVCGQLGAWGLQQEKRQRLA